MNNLFKSRPVKKGGTGAKKGTAALKAPADKRPPRPISTVAEVAGEATGNTLTWGKTSAPVKTTNSVADVGKEMGEKGNSEGGGTKLAGQKRKASSQSVSLAAETAAVLERVEGLSAHTIPASSALGHGYGGDLPVADLWKSFHNDYVALGKRFAWLDQCLALRKSELVKAQANADVKVKGLEAEIKALKDQMSAVEKEREEWKEKASSGHSQVIKEYLSSDEAKKARLEADQAAVKAFCQSADLERLVEERVAAWKTEEGGQAWLQEQRTAFLKSREMADFFITGMTAARTMGITELAQALRIEQGNLPDDFPDSFDLGAYGKVMNIAAEFGVDLKNRTPPEEEDEEADDEDMGDSEDPGRRIEASQEMDVDPASRS